MKNKIGIVYAISAFEMTKSECVDGDYDLNGKANDARLSENT